MDLLIKTKAKIVCTDLTKTPGREIILNFLDNKFCCFSLQIGRILSVVFDHHL